MTNLDKAPLFCDTARAETLAHQQALSEVDQPVHEIQPIQDIPAMLDGIESMMLTADQVDCPVQHHFGPGIYIREVFMPAGTYVMGHWHKSEHTNIMLNGKMAVIVNDQAKVIEGPCIFIGQPGRKFAYIIEDTIFQNVYATDETDIEKLEEMLFDKSESWEAIQNVVKQLDHQKHQEDRDDFSKMIEAYGFSEEFVRAVSEEITDRIDMPKEWRNYVAVRPSSIEGSGLFSMITVSAGDVICPARINGMRTEAGRFTNHSKSPNAKFVAGDDGDIFLVAMQDIDACHGNSTDTEITVDYRQALSLSGLYIQENAA